MIYLLRHGEIKGASTKRFIGQTDVGLSEAGLEHAALWQNYFSRLKIDHVFASPLSRCIDMAAIVSGFEKHAITLMDGLKEINLGKWDGKPIAEIRDKFSEEWEKRGNDFTGYRPPWEKVFWISPNGWYRFFIKLPWKIQGISLWLPMPGSTT